MHTCMEVVVHTHTHTEVSVLKKSLFILWGLLRTAEVDSVTLQSYMLILK